MKDLIAHWKGFESISIGASVLTIERRALVQAVFQAADSVNWPKTISTENAAPAPILRTVVLYCLATNVCPSQEIIEASETDPTVKYLCAHHSLDWQTVHEFRKRHSLFIREGLVQLFQNISAQTPSVALKHVTRLEADLRVRRAVQADSTVLDL